MLDPGCFEHGVFVCVDMHAPTRGPLADDRLPRVWRERGFDPADVNRALRYAEQVAVPNARRAADVCRRLGVPCVFVWFGDQASAPWQGAPAASLGIRAGDRVVRKTLADAFEDGTLVDVLAGLDAETLIFAGGFTEDCLRRTALTARRRGYRTVCLQDATTNVRESTRMRGIVAAGFDEVIGTNDLLCLARDARLRAVEPGYIQ